MKDIKKLREQIDLIDKQILLLVKQRMDIVKKIGKIKKQNKLEVKDLKREKEIIAKLYKQGKKLKIQKKLIKTIWSCFFATAYKEEK